MVKSRLRVVAVAWAQCCCFGGSTGQMAYAQPASDSGTPIAQFCIDGFRAGRERLRSASVRVQVDAVAQGKRNPRHSYFLAFDRATNGVRFDDETEGRRFARCGCLTATF